MIKVGWHTQVESMLDDAELEIKEGEDIIERPVPNAGTLLFGCEDKMKDEL